MEIENNISSFLKNTVTKCVFKPKQNGQKYVKKKKKKNTNYVLPCAPRRKQQTFYTAWCGGQNIPPSRDVNPLSNHLRVRPMQHKTC